MKTTKNIKKKKKELSDSVSESSDSAPENGKIYGFRFQPKFSDAIDAAASKLGMTRSNFVRIAIARAIEDAGIFVGEEAVLMRQGQQSAPKEQVDASAAGARAVRNAKRAGTPENARYKALVGGGMHTQAALDYLYAKAKAERFVGRSLTPEEDAEFLSSASRAYEELPEEEILRRAVAGMGDGPPVFPDLP